MVMPTLNQLADLSPDQERALLWLTVLLSIVVVGGLAIMLLRKLISDRWKNSTVDAGFSLSDLREMRDRGEITPEEYDATRARVLAKVKASFNKNPPPKPSDEFPPPGDAA